MNKGGRPPKYKTARQLQAVIDDFFEDCEDKRIIPTVTGLTLALGFSSRQTLLNYKEKPEFLDTIKKAKLRVEHALETNLLISKNPGGTIFNLKNNFGWKDKSEKEMYGKDGGPITTTQRSVLVVPEPQDQETWATGFMIEESED